MLIGLSGSAALSAVILNKAMSLVVVLVAWPARLASVPGRRCRSLSPLVALPTMLVAFARYSRDGNFAVLGADLRFTAIMATGSIAGAILGGLLLGVSPDLVLIPLPAVILLVSAVKPARHG